MKLNEQKYKKKNNSNVINLVISLIYSIIISIIIKVKIKRKNKKQNLYYINTDLFGISYSKFDPI